MKKIIALVLSVLILGGITGYIALGGFKKPEINAVDTKSYILAGVSYKGAASDDELQQLFEQTRKHHQAGKLTGTLAALYLDIPDSDKGKIDAFVGVLVKDSATVLPEEYSYKYIPVNKAVQATINTHYLVAPSPDKIKASMFSYAQEKGLTLHNFVIEQYLNDTNIILHIPIKAN